MKRITKITEKNVNKTIDGFENPWATMMKIITKGGEIIFCTAEKSVRADYMLIRLGLFKTERMDFEKIHSIEFLNNLDLLNLMSKLSNERTRFLKKTKSVISQLENMVGKKS